MSDLPRLVPGCIQANPDIAGIGVRVAIYTQNFISLILAIAALGDRYVSWKEMFTIESQSMSVVLTACALLLSAVVQAATFGMSTYHALIVLNLAWMNNTNSLVYAILFRYQGILSTPFRSDGSRRAGSNPPPKKKALPMLTIGSLHLSFVGGFGLWFWAKIDTFGASAQCAPLIPVPLVILGHGFPITNHSLHKISLAIYGIIAVPGLNLVVVVGVIYGLAILLTGIGELFFGISSFTAFFAPGYISVGLLLGINAVIAVDTELMIKQTKALVQPGESQWTFGQTLAIFLLILPLRDILLLCGQDERLRRLGMARDRQWAAHQSAKKGLKKRTSEPRARLYHHPIYRHPSSQSAQRAGGATNRRRIIRTLPQPGRQPSQIPPVRYHPSRRAPPATKVGFGAKRPPFSAPNIPLSQSTWPISSSSSSSPSFYSPDSPAHSPSLWPPSPPLSQFTAPKPSVSLWSLTHRRSQSLPPMASTSVTPFSLPPVIPSPPILQGVPQVFPPTPLAFPPPRLSRGYSNNASRSIGGGFGPTVRFGHDRD